MLNTFGLGGAGVLIKDELLDEIEVDLSIYDISINIEDNDNDDITIEISNNC